MQETIDKIVNNIINIVGIDSVVTESSQKAPYETDWRNQFYGTAMAIIFPHSTQEIVQIIKLCNQQNISVIPQGGNTSLCGGATPLRENTTLQIIINLSKMNHILELDINNHSITVEAGCTLNQVTTYVAEYNLYFPLSIASEGSCQIGGNIATNAGGIHVIKYGTMRNLVLGLEVILADGNVINQLYKLRKNNTNFDLNQLFIGSEGTLGIITKATLQLYPKPLGFYTGLVGVNSIAQALELLHQFKNSFNLCAFEIINKATQNIYNNIFKDNQTPVQTEWLILFEIELFNLDIEYNQEQNMSININTSMLNILQTQQINLDNVIIATNSHERSQLWYIREHIPLAEKLTGTAIKHDIATPISNIEEFIKINTQNLKNLPELQNTEHALIIFGHLGDGNLHYNIQFMAHDKTQVANLAPKINTIVYNDLMQYNGTFSAEHGIGQLKTTWYRKYCDPTTYKIAQSIKNLLDPKLIFNPKKIFE